MNTNLVPQDNPINHFDHWLENLNNAEERLAKWIEFHRANPHVWTLFEKYALEAARSGQKTYGARAIMERVRWDFHVSTHGDAFKINNNFVSFYARLFLNAHPELPEMLKTRIRNQRKRK